MTIKCTLRVLKPLEEYSEFRLLHLLSFNFKLVDILPIPYVVEVVRM